MTDSHKMGSLEGDLVSTFSGNLKRIRTETGLSQGDFAEKLGMPQSYISRLERGIHSPSVDVAVQLARALGVTIENLVGEPGPALQGDVSLAATSFIGEISKRNARVIALLREWKQDEELPEAAWDICVRTVILSLEILLESRKGERGK